MPFKIGFVIPEVCMQTILAVPFLMKMRTGNRKIVVMCDVVRTIASKNLHATSSCRRQTHDACPPESVLTIIFEYETTSAQRQQITIEHTHGTNYFFH